ncbi:hypothetical protein C922_02812 [Plasmodium inui San Antonio 1]|uniref:Uncharacterized protein n=1 Tax=Plasmodium inui San Antonio 1 TaxID=1237626 RepID=W7A0V7_9APIC|nr:hypothetical protein C922_02812 [Plasmodium inui San Antonio 1]EUD66827.1 hypothetical protein C922_02812 [Plasmodium inui San Antonio 1]
MMDRKGEEPQAGEREKPISEKPISEKPISEKPISEKPISEKPISEKPIRERPIRERPIREKPIQETPLLNSDTADGNDRAGQAPYGRGRQWNGRKNRIRSPSACQSVNSCDSAKSDYSCRYLNADSYGKNVSLCTKCLFTYFEFNSVMNVIYMRHGARTPKKKIQNVWPFKEGKGDLTFLGFQQSVKIGKYLRKYYYSMRKLNSIYNDGGDHSGGESVSHESDEETNMMRASTPWDQLQGGKLNGGKLNGNKHNRHRLKENFGTLQMGRKKKNLKENLRRERRLKETIKLLVSKNPSAANPCRMLHKRVTHKVRWTPFCQDRKGKEPTSLHVCRSVCANYCGKKKRKRKKRKKKNDKVINVDHSMRDEVPSEAALSWMNPLDGGTPIGYLNKDTAGGAWRGKDTLSSICEMNHLPKQLEKRIHIEKQKRKYDEIVKIINKYLCVKTTSSQRCKLTAYAIMCGILGITEKMFFFFFLLSFDNEEYDLLHRDMIRGSEIVSENFRSVSRKREDRLHPLSIPQKDLPNSSSILERRKSSLPAQVNFLSQQNDSSVATDATVRPRQGTHLAGCHPLECLQGGKSHHVTFAPVSPNSICNFTEKDFEGDVPMGEQQHLRDAAENCITRSGGSGNLDRVQYNQSEFARSDPPGETSIGGKCPQNGYQLFVEPPRDRWVSSMVAFTDEDNRERLDRSAKKDVKKDLKMDEVKLLSGVTSFGGDAPIVEKKREDACDKKRPDGHDEPSNRRSDARTGGGANWKAENAQSYSDSVNPSWGVLNRSLGKGTPRSGAARKAAEKFRPSSTLIHNVKTFFEFALSGRYNSTLFYNKIMKAKGRNERKLEKSCISFIFESYMRYVLSDFAAYVSASGGVPRRNDTNHDAENCSGLLHDQRFVSPAWMVNWTPHPSGYSNGYPSSYPSGYRRNLLSYLRNIYILFSVVHVAERNSLMLKTLKSNNHYIKRLKNLIFYNSNVYKLLNDHYKEEISIVYRITKWRSRSYLNRSELLLSEPWANTTQSDVAEDEWNIKNRIVKILKKHNSDVYKIKKKLNKSIILKDLRKLNYYSVDVTLGNVPTCEQRKVIQEKVRSMRNHLLFYSKRKNIKIIKKFISSYDAYVYHNVRLVLDMRKVYRNVQVQCSSSSETVLGVATPEMGKKEHPNGGDNCGPAGREGRTRKAVAFREGGDPHRWYYNVQRGGAQDGAEKWPPVERASGLDGRCAGDYSKGECTHRQEGKGPKGSLHLCEAAPDESPDHPLVNPPDDSHDSPSEDSSGDPPDTPSEDPLLNPREAKRPDETAEKKEKNKAKSFYKKIYECYKHMCTLEYNNKYLSWLCSGMSLMDVVINFMISVRVYENFNREMATGWGGGKKFIPKIIVYLTHQSSILSFQSCVGVKRSSMKIPPFGGFLSLELVHIRKKGGDMRDRGRGHAKRHKHGQTSSKVSTKVHRKIHTEVHTDVHTALQMDSKAKGDLGQFPREAAQGDPPLSTAFDEPASRRRNLRVTGQARSADRHNVQTFIRENDTASIFCCKEDCVWKVRWGNGRSGDRHGDGHGADGNNADGDKSNEHDTHGQNPDGQGADRPPAHADRAAHITTTQARKRVQREDKYESYLPKCANKIHDFKNLFNLLCYRDSNVESNVDTLIQLYNLCLSDKCSYVGNTELNGGQEGQPRRRRYFYGYFVKFTFNHYFPLKLKRKKCIKRCKRGGREETGRMNGTVKKGIPSTLGEQTHQGREEVDGQLDGEMAAKEKEKTKNNHTNWKQRKEDSPGEVTNIEGRSLAKGQVLPSSVVGRKDKPFDTNGDKFQLATKKGSKETSQRVEFRMKNTYKGRTNDQSDDYPKDKHLRRNKIMQRLNMNSFNFDSKHDKYMHYVYNSSDLKYGRIYSKLNKEGDSKFSTKKSVDINNRLMERSRIKLNGGGSSISSEESTHDELELRNGKFKSLGRGEEARKEAKKEAKKEANNEMKNGVKHQMNSVNCAVNGYAGTSRQPVQSRQDHLYRLKSGEVDEGQQNSTPMGYSFKLSKRAMSSRLLKNCMTEETEKRKRKKMQKMQQMQKMKPGFNRKKDESDKRNYQNENIICLDCLISYLRQMLRVYGNPEML